MLALACPAAADIPRATMNDTSTPGTEALSQAAGLPQLSVVVPTFNERDNVTVLYRRLDATLKDISWEVVFVDDNSPDGTWEVVRALAESPEHSHLTVNGDVDASKLRRWDDHE